MKLGIATIFLIAVLALLFSGISEGKICTDEYELFCESECDHFWGWCVESSPSKACYTNYWDGCDTFSAYTACCGTSPGF